MCENSLDENILIPSQLQLMEHEEIACVLIVGSINLLWKINLTNVLVVIKKKQENLNNIMLPYQLRRLYRPREDKKK